MSTTVRVYFTQSVAVLVLANLVTIGMAVWQSWRLIDVLWIYWVQSFFMMLFTWSRILNLEYIQATTNKPMEPTPDTPPAWCFLVFFGVWYLFYLAMLTHAKEPALGMRDEGFAICILAFFVTHTFSYFRNRQEDRNRTPNVSSLWIFPGLRLVPLYVGLGSTMRPGSSQGLSLLQFFILQTTVEVIIHIAQHADTEAKI